MHQSGLSHQWWDEAMKCFCYLRNITDVVDHGMTPYQFRFGKFPGHQIPFGAEIRYKMPLGANQATLKFEEETLSGIFVGYGQHPGGK